MKDEKDRFGLCPLRHPAFCGDLSRRGFLELCNYYSPPSAACITNTGAIVEGAEDDPHQVAGFHVLQIYGDHVRKLRDFCQLYRIEAVHSWDQRVSFDFEPNCA